jgi:hypothetical protein
VYKSGPVSVHNIHISLNHNLNHNVYRRTDGLKHLTNAISKKAMKVVPYENVSFTTPYALRPAKQLQCVPNLA